MQAWLLRLWGGLNYGEEAALDFFKQLEEQVPVEYKGILEKGRKSIKEYRIYKELIKARGPERRQEGYYKREGKFKVAY